MIEETDSQFIARMQEIFERSDDALNEILSEEAPLINEFLREI